MKVYNKSGIQDFRRAIGFNRKCLEIIGAWPKDGNNTFNLHQFLQVILECVFLGLCAAWPQLYALALFHEDMDLIFQNLFAVIEYSTSAFKLFILWINMDVLQIILDSILLDWCTFNVTWQRDIMLKVANRGRWLTNGCLTFSFIVVIGSSTMPALGYNLRINIANVTNLNGRILPLSSRYPYDFSKTPYFEICYISQVACCGLGLISMSSPLTLLGVFVNHVCGQIEILCIKMESLCKIPSVNRGKGSYLNNRDWWMNLGEIVTIHAKIIRFVGNIEKYLNVLVLVQIIFTPVTMCLIGFRAITVFNNKDGKLIATEAMLLTFNFFVFLTHAFIFCFIGESLISHSEELHRSIYKTEWYACCERKMLSLVPIMALSQNSLRLLAGKYICLNLETFCNILKTAASYLSALVAINAQKKEL